MISTSTNTRVNKTLWQYTDVHYGWTSTFVFIPHFFFAVVRCRHVSAPIFVVYMHVHKHACRVLFACTLDKKAIGNRYSDILNVCTKIQSNFGKYFIGFYTLIGATVALASCVLTRQSTKLNVLRFHPAFLIHKKGDSVSQLHKKVSPLIVQILPTGVIFHLPALLLGSSSHTAIFFNFCWLYSLVLQRDQSYANAR